MLFRNFLLSVFSFGAGACLLLPATSAGLPKEGTCHNKIRIEAKESSDMLGAAPAIGIATWIHTNTITFDCGQTQWPAMKERCFGIDELTGGSRLSTAYCIDTDHDGDKVVWKLVPSKTSAYSQETSGSFEVLMASGKYTGMSGKLTFECGFSGSNAVYFGKCDGAMTFKFP
jgi:hypothetical protein